MGDRIDKKDLVVEDRAKGYIDGLLNRMDLMFNNRIAFVQSKASDSIIENIESDKQIITLTLKDTDIDASQRDYFVSFGRVPYVVDQIEIETIDNTVSAAFITYDEDMNRGETFKTQCKFNEYFRLEHVVDDMYELVIATLPPWLVYPTEDKIKLIESFPIVETEDFTGLVARQLHYITKVYAYLNPTDVPRTLITTVATPFGNDSNKMLHQSKISLARSSFNKVRSINLVPGAVIKASMMNRDELFRIDDIDGEVMLCTNLTNSDTEEQRYIPLEYFISDDNASIIPCVETIYNYNESNRETTILHPGDTNTDDEKTVDLLYAVSNIIDAAITVDKLDQEKIQEIIIKVQEGEQIDESDETVKSVETAYDKVNNAIADSTEIISDMFDSKIRIYDENNAKLITYSILQLADNFNILSDIKEKLGI